MTQTQGSKIKVFFTTGQGSLHSSSSIGHSKNQVEVSKMLGKSKVEETMAGMLHTHSSTKTNWHRREGTQRLNTLGEGRQIDADETHKLGAGSEEVCGK